MEVTAAIMDNKIRQGQKKLAVIAEPSEEANDSVDAPSMKNELKNLADFFGEGETQEEGNDAIKFPAVMEGPKTMVEMFGGGKMLEEAGYFDGDDSSFEVAYVRWPGWLVMEP